MNGQAPSAEALRRLLGKTVLFKNQHFRVIEVLDHELSLVLGSLEQTEIQSDLHGRAKRQCISHLIIRALDEPAKWPKPGVDVRAGPRLSCR